MCPIYMPLVWKVRQGRSILYQIKWYSCLNRDGDYFESAVLRDEIRRKRAAKDMEVQRTSARRVPDRATWTSCTR
ncbi:hypothetical protein [Streptomyces sp. NPDC096012]|uniref:hypothetical protein n=1 Tax=Streptomyces sp. NPDC096012 TaxID=3155684 RepID=UPI00336AB268